jgi:hypothetical protein
VFAYRLFETFNSVRGDTGVTVGEFLKKFALNHGKTGQQPQYKVLPDNSMFSEPLFGPFLAQTIRIVDHGGVKMKGGVPMPAKK